MSYKQLRKQRSETRQKLRSAKQQKKDLESSIAPLQEEFQQSYHDLTEIRAKHEIDDATKKDVDKAKKKNQKIKAKIEETKESIDTKEKVIDLLSERLNEIESDFHSVAKQHHKKKVKPHFDAIDEALATINNEIEQLNEYRHELQKDGIRAAAVLGDIDHGSEAVITTGKMPSVERRKFITQKDTQHA